MASDSSLRAITPDLVPPRPLAQRDPLMRRDGETPPIQTEPVTHADASPVSVRLSVPQALAPNPAVNRFSGSVAFSIQQTISVGFSLELGGINTLATYGPSGEFRPGAHLDAALGSLLDVTA